MEAKSCRESYLERKKSLESDLSNVIERAYSIGFKDGSEEVKSVEENLRGTCVRESGEDDIEYVKGECEHGFDMVFVGWCSNCKRPHEGRYSGWWDFCPFCGSKLKKYDENGKPLESTPDTLIGSELLNWKISM